jgi:hypothetical protein
MEATFWLSVIRQVIKLHELTDSIDNQLAVEMLEEGISVDIDTFIETIDRREKAWHDNL